MDFLPIMGKKYDCTLREDFAHNGQNFCGMYHLYQHRPKQNKKFLIKLRILDWQKFRLGRRKRAWIVVSDRDCSCFAHSYQCKLKRIKWFLMILLFLRGIIFLPIMGKSTIVYCGRPLPMIGKKKHLGMVSQGVGAFDSFHSRFSLATSSSRCVIYICP